MKYLTCNHNLFVICELNFYFFKHHFMQSIVIFDRNLFLIEKYTRIKSFRTLDHHSSNNDISC